MEEEVAQYLQKFDSSFLISKGIGVFENVGYFSETYKGKMFITPQAIYYFPLKRSNEIEETGDEKSLFSLVFWELLFLVGFITASIYFYKEGLLNLIAMLLPILSILGRLISKLVSRFSNRKNKKENLIPEANSFLTIDQLYKQLDEFIKTKKLETAYFDEDSVPHPIKFAKDGIYDMFVNNKRGLPILKFRTENDEHDFVFSSKTHGLVRNSLIENGFLNPLQN